MENIKGGSYDPNNERGNERKKPAKKIEPLKKTRDIENLNRK